MAADRGLPNWPAIRPTFTTGTLAAAIIAAASFAWTVYTDMKKRNAHPAPEAVARTTRVKLRESDQTVPDHVVEVVVTEVIQAGAGQDDASQ